MENYVKNAGRIVCCVAGAAAFCAASLTVAHYFGTAAMNIFKRGGVFDQMRGSMSGIVAPANGMGLGKSVPDQPIKVTKQMTASQYLLSKDYK